MPEPYSLRSFGLSSDPAADASDVFQAAIDAAYFEGAQHQQSRGGVVQVPWRDGGYRITGVNMRSHVRLQGMGGFVALQNVNSEFEHTIICDGADGTNGDGVHRWSTIENFVIDGVGKEFGSKDGIHYSAHDNTHVRHCRIRRHGGAGIYGEKGASSKSDGLVVESCYLDVNGYGLYLLLNSHYVSLIGTNRLVNNRVNNARVSCAAFTMFGGVMNTGDTGPGLYMVNCNGGGVYGTEFEATPSLASGSGTLVHFGDTVEGGCRGVGLYGCLMTGSGNDGDLTIVDFANATGCRVDGGFADANCNGDVLAFNFRSTADRCSVNGLHTLRQSGAGGWTDQSDSGNLTTFDIIA